MIILGLSPIVHESAVGILVDGELVAAAAEERFTREKNQGGFPRQALSYVLSKAGVKPSEIDYVAYAALPFGKERLADLRNYGANLAYVVGAQEGLSSRLRHLANYSRAMVVNKEWLSWGRSTRVIEKELSTLSLQDRLVYLDHHLSHCASAYFTSGFESSLVVSLDGYGSGQAGSFYLGKAGTLELLSSIPYPHSLGTFYRRVTQALGYKPNRHEGKIVGLAAYGDPTKLYDEILSRFDFGHKEYFRFKNSQDPWYEKRLVDKYEPADIAAAYQRVLEEVAVRYIRYWVQRTNVCNVACAGGVFANVKMNQRIMEIPEVENLYIFPAMGDGGVGIGAAYALCAQLNHLEPHALQHVYLGPEYSETHMEEALRKAGVRYRHSSEPEREIAQHLVQGKVVARFNGAMEFGPRALGNRSILYPAKDPSVNKWLNDRLKRTEFMPFAPISLSEHAEELYPEIGKISHAAQFMTVTTNCSSKMKAQSPAAVHVDGTARPQLVRRETNPSAYKILSYYHELSGIPTLINTSFNMHEEPIVCSPEDAVRGFLDGRLEVLALGNFLVEAYKEA